MSKHISRSISLGLRSLRIWTPFSRPFQTSLTIPPVLSPTCPVYMFSGFGQPMGSPSGRWSFTAGGCSLHFLRSGCLSGGPLGSVSGSHVPGHSPPLYGRMRCAMQGRILMLFDLRCFPLRIWHLCVLLVPLASLVRLEHYMLIV